MFEADEAWRSELGNRYDELVEEHNGNGEDLPDDVAAELERIKAELAVLEATEEAWQAEDVAVAGVVLTLASDGSLRAERRYVRADDEPQPEPVTPDVDGTEADGIGETGTDDGADETPIGGGSVTAIRGEAEAEDKAPALSAALLAELQAHRTAGLQAAIAGQSELAVRVLLHAFATDAFYSCHGETVACLHTYPPALTSTCPGSADDPAHQAMSKAEDGWRSRLPREHRALGWLEAQDATTLLDMLAVCVARTVNAGSRIWTSPAGGQCIAALVVAAAELDMWANWMATKDGYFGRVLKALILDALREGAGTGVANPIAGSKKEVMVADAEQVLAGTGWLPAVLHVPGTTYPVDSGDATGRQPSRCR